jgi:hypothetical protein
MGTHRRTGRWAVGLGLDKVEVMRNFIIIIMVFASIVIVVISISIVVVIISISIVVIVIV